MTDSCCHPPKNHPDYLLWSTLLIVAIAYSAVQFAEGIMMDARLVTFTGNVYELMNQMFWGIALGIVFVGILGNVPRELPSTSPPTGERRTA